MTYPSPTNASGFWTLKEAQFFRAANTWPRGPAAPTGLAATSGNAQLVLSWTAPATTNGTITNYLVEYTASGGSPQYVLTNSTSTSYTLTGLTNGTAYTARVAAVNFTAGDYSSAVTGTPLGIALAVSPATITNQIGSPTFTWSGAGTALDKLTTGGSYRQGRFNFNQGPSLLQNYTFACGVSGTLFFEWSTEDNGDGGEDIFNWTGYSRNGAASSSFATTQTNVSGISKRGISVTSGDTINWTTKGGLAVFIYTPWSAWIE